MTITKRDGKYYCRFQIDGERHHYLCAGAKDEKEARKIEQGFMYKVQQQQNGIIPKKAKQVKLSYLFDVFEDFVKINESPVYKNKFKENSDVYTEEIETVIRNEKETEFLALIYI